MNEPRSRDAAAVSLALIVGLLPCLSAHPQTPPPALPEGNTGIAASYPNDNGIAAHANVLFADGFESYGSAGELPGSGSYDVYYHEEYVALDASTHFGGSKSLRMRLPSGGDLYNAIVRGIVPTRDALHMRVYARYQPGYAGVVYAHNGLRITGSYQGPGQRPDGTDFFLVSIENSRLGSEPEPGYTHAYVYHPEQDDAYGEHWFSDGSTSNGSQSFGPHFIARPKVTPTRGEWICYEVLVQLNTPGSRDGRVAVWQDGSLIADWTGVRFRDVGTVKIDEIQLEHGGQGSDQQNDKWYDDLVIATSYIGPMASSSVKAPQPPTDLRVVR